MGARNRERERETFCTLYGCFCVCVLGGGQYMYIGVCVGGKGSD